MAPMIAQAGQKRKHVALSLQDKLKLIEKLDKGASVASVCAEYGIAKQTVSDIRKKKQELLNFSMKFSVENEKTEVKRMRMPADERLEEAVYKWFQEQRSSGVTVRGVEIQAAAERLAKRLGVAGFTASSGWLFRFRRRHNIVNTKKVENLSAQKLKLQNYSGKTLDQIIKADGVWLSQLYNMEKTGLLWRVLPECMQISKREKVTAAQKISKERASANADGRHLLEPITVAESGIVQSTT